MILKSGLAACVGACSLEAIAKGAEEVKKNPSWPAADPGTSVSGIVGSVLVLALVLLLGSTIKAIRKRKAK